MIASSGQALQEVRNIWEQHKGVTPLTTLAGEPLSFGSVHLNGLGRKKTPKIQSLKQLPYELV